MSKIQSSLVPDNIFPFKHQFQKKFVGKQGQQLLALKRRLLKDPIDKQLKQIFGDTPSLYPKVIQLQKINNASRKAGILPLKGQNMSPLQIYISKKQLMKYQQSKLFMTMPHNPKMSDQQIIDRFSQFLVAKKYGQNNNNLRNALTFAVSLAQKPKINQIYKRKVEIQTIIHTMIRQNKSAQDNHEDIYSEDHSDSETAKKTVNKNINWVLKQCNKYVSKYAIRHRKSKSTKKF